MSFLENKIPPPLIALLCALLMWTTSPGIPALEGDISLRIVAAAISALLGVVVCLAGVLSFRRAKTTVNPLKPHKASSLVIAGIYRVSRNPMYLGFALLLNAWAIFLAFPWAFLGIAAFVLYMNRFQITPEERALTALFGEEFRRYQSQVRRWV